MAGAVGSFDARSKVCEPSVDRLVRIGAREIAARYSYLDLNDANIEGGRLSEIALGVNWYLNPHTKFQFNYIRALLDRGPVGDSAADIVAMRAQVDF